MKNNLYQKTDLYDLGYMQRDMSMLKEYYNEIFFNKSIESIHDCSIGTGHLTLPLAEMGYKVSGSDISSKMLKKAQKNADEKEVNIKLFKSDFLKLSDVTSKRYDCVMSTGNSLAHVKNKEVKVALKEMSQLIKEEGYIYFDTRNWDKIITSKQRFYLYNPFFVNENRINLVQVWDHISDEEIIFNLLYTFEKNNKIFRKEQTQVTYYPISRELLIQTLENLGFIDIQVNNFIDLAIDDFSQMDWYSVIAKKSKKL